LAILQGGTGGATGAGGAIQVNGGVGGATSGAGGAISVTGGAASGSGNGGLVSVIGGAATSGGTGGGLTAGGGTGNGAGAGGAVSISGGNGGATGAGGATSLAGGSGGATSGAAGSVTVRGGTPTDGNGGDATLQGSDGIGTNRSGGSVTITAGQRTGAGTGGSIFFKTGNAATTERMRVEPGGFVAIGAPGTATSTLHVAGSISLKSSTTVGSATLDDTRTVALIDASGGNATVNLPAAAGATDRIYYIKKIDSSANTVTIDANGAETIDGATTQTLLTQYDALQIVSDGTQWFIL
jgi:hypothetical protein